MPPRHHGCHESSYSCAGGRQQVKLPCPCLDGASQREDTTMRVGKMAAIALAAAAATTATTVPAAAAGDALLPHPGPDGRVWVPEWTGDGGGAGGGGGGREATGVSGA